MFEYLAQVQSAVRRINDRIKTLSEKFGESNERVQSIVSAFDVTMSDNWRYKDGVPQLHTPSEIFKNPDAVKSLEYFDKSIKTWGSYRKEYLNQYESYEAEAKFMKEDVIPIEDYITTMENLNNAFQSYDSSQFPDKALEILREKYKTYGELKQAMNILKEEGYI